MTFLGDICHDAVPGFLGLFDLSIAPSLLFYSYIPIIAASTIIGLYVFYKDKRSLKSRLLLAVILFFVLWVINILVQWVGAYNTIIMLGWQLTAIFEVGMFLATAYFVRVFLYEKDISFTEKIVFLVVSVMTLAVIPTSLNVTSYDIVNCEGVNGFLWNIIYAFEPAIIVLIMWWGLIAYRLEENRARRKQILLFIVGVTLFLTTFFISNYYGELIKMYEFNLWGPIGMVIFLILLGYMIVKYQTFNIKTFATQALVVSTTLLIGSLFFNQNVYILAATFALFLASGLLLIKSVKGEIEQRERVEQLAEQLSEFMSLATHEIRNPATFIKGSAAGALEGDLGELTPAMKDTMQKIFVRVNDIIHLGNQYLDKSKLELNRLKYEFVPTDLAKVVSDLVHEFEPAAIQRGIAITTVIDNTGEYTVQADSGKIKEVVGNLIDNAIKYTKEGNGGTVAISVIKAENTVTMKITDNGNGIPAKTIPELFKKFSRADAQKANLLGTGLGLYLADIFIKAHHGRIWVESEGVDKGSTFFVELPITQPDTGGQAVAS